MRFKLEIKMDNAAFEEPSGTELARILRDLADDLAEMDCFPGYSKTLMDINGNRVGQAKTT